MSVTPFHTSLGSGDKSLVDLGPSVAAVSRERGREREGGSNGRAKSWKNNYTFPIFIKITVKHYQQT